MFNRIRSLFSSRSIQIKTDPNEPVALYWHPSGKVYPLTMKSFNGDGWGGDYNALQHSMSGKSLQPGDQAYTWISEINVWVRRCLEIRSANINRLDWYVEDTTTGRRINEHPYMVAARRSPRYFKRVEWSQDIWGETYVKPLMNDYEYYSDLWWLNNLSISFTIVNGQIFQFYFVPLHGGKPDVWKRHQIAYVHNDNAFDDLRGSSRILSVLQEAGVHEQIAIAAQSHFANGARPGIMLLPKRNLGLDKSQEFIDWWKKNFQGSSNVNKPVMLPEQIESIQVIERAELKDDVEFRGSIRREICAGFGVPLSIAGAWDDANYQSAPEQRKSLYEDTLIPEADTIAADQTREVLPFFEDRPRCRVWYDAKKLLALAEDKQAKAAALNSQLVSGGLTLNQYRQALDQEAIPQGNVFYVPSSVVVTPVEKLGTMPPPAPPGGGGFFGQSSPTPAPPSGEAAPEPTKDAPGMAMILSLKNNVDLIGLQKRLKELLPDPAIQWTDPEAFHVTLIYAPVVDEAALEELVSCIRPYTTPALALNVGSLASFDSAPGVRSIHLRVRGNSDLTNYQEDLRIACENAGIVLSAYSQTWKPHITMAYAPDRMKVATYSSNLNVKPDEMQVSVERAGQYEVVYRAACGQPNTIEAAPETPEKVKGLPGSTEFIEVIEPPLTTRYGSAFDGINQNGDEPHLPESHISLPVDPFFDELADYEKFSLNRFGAPTRAFKFEVLPEALRAELTEQVAVCRTKGEIKRLFAGLRDHLSERAESDFVTPEQAQEWWGDYDRLMKEIGTTWLTDYMREVWRRVEPQLSDTFDADKLKPLLEDFHPDLINAWTGTAEEPGAIAKLFMAGMGAGQAALVRKRTNMNPNKASGIEGIDIDWSLVPEDAIKYAEKYIGKLIKGIDKTTLDDVRRIVMQWLESGQPVSELSKQLNPIFNDPARAELIASTEASNAYNGGAIQRWDDAGVTQMKFKTVRDAIVCPQCEALNGQIGTLENGWDGIFIPVHPRCRCFASPVL